MPVLFVGHGSPMNALEENEFVNGWREIAKTIPKPKGILCISAHWETDGTFLTAMEKPRTIHDFSGFPKELFDMQYPAPGNPLLADEIKHIIKKTVSGMDDRWGLDHGCWSVLSRFYPGADIPVIQMSLDRRKTPLYHFELAKELSLLRRQGILIVGSGNIVHNLYMIAWDKLNENYGYDWTLEVSEKTGKWIVNGDYQQLINFNSHGAAFNRAIPTPEHFLPLLYTLALVEKDDHVTLFNDKPVAGSLTMTCVKINKAY